MAHEITETDIMIYTGRKPWHKLGKQMSQYFTAEQACIDEGLGWTVSSRELITTDGVNLPGFRAIMRDDTQICLSVKTPDYKPFQNIEKFAFFDTVVGSGDAHYETAGSLMGGKKVYMIARLKGDLLIAGKDKVEKYLALVDSFDGTCKLRMYFTPVRIVCNNTLNMSLKQQEKPVAICHRGDLEGKVYEAKKVLGFADEYYKSFEEIANALWQKKVDSEMVKKFIESVFKVEGEEEVATRTRNNMEQVEQLFREDVKNHVPGMEDSMWGLYNAATQFADHEMTAVQGTQERRMNSVMFGQSLKLKDRALEFAMSAIK